MLRPGDELNGYRIVAPLRSGGMARLYLARREGVAGFARAAAIKVIHPHLAKERRFVDLFIAEARLSSQIEDPNVVRVEELGETSGVLFLAMEYVHGVSLSELIKALGAKGRRLSFEAVAHIGARVASALHAAHETSDAGGKPLGIVHCDVSPQNVLISFGGHVKLIDFGVARALGATNEASQLSVRGKLAYMAPEQAQARRPDRRTDVYALGLVLWELLTLQRMFDAANDVALFVLVKDGAVMPLREHAPHVPEALSAVVMKALSRDPGDRYATAQELSRALADAVPSSRELEADEVGQLVQAAMPEETKKKDALLALAVPDAIETLEADATDDDQANTFDRTSPFRRPRPSVVALEHLTLPVASRPDALAPATQAHMTSAPSGDVEPTTELLARPAPIAPIAPVAQSAQSAPARDAEPPPRRWPWVPLVAGLVVLVWFVSRGTAAVTDDSAATTITTTTATTTTIAEHAAIAEPTAAPVATTEEPPVPVKEPATVSPTSRAAHRAKAPRAAPSAPSVPANAPSVMRCRMVGGVELCQ